MDYPVQMGMVRHFGGGYPEDKSDKVARIEAREARRYDRRDRQDARQERRRLARTRSDAAGAALDSAMRFFEERGMGTEEYADDIQSMLNEIMAGIAKDDPNPGNYLKNLGQTVWDSETEQRRGNVMRDLNRYVPQDFEYTRIDPTLDDATLAAIESEQRTEAEKFIDGLIARGVITEAGGTSARAALDKQKHGVMATLEELGRTALEGGRQSLRDIGGRARTTASTLALDTPFDPFKVSTDIDREFNEFLSGLSGGIRGKVSGNLYDTAGLPVIASAGAGAGNTKFDPKALAGVFEDEEDDGGGGSRTDTTIF